MSRWLYYLLGLAVIAPLIDLISGPQQVTAIFVFSAIGLIPLAALIGRATEDLEYHVGPIVGGLLNASFGNAPEIIICIFAIQHGLITVVKASITGSIISNSLLVLGSSLALGGWHWGKQYFSARDAGQYSTMMVLAVAGLLIPSTSSLVVKDSEHIQSISIPIVGNATEHSSALIIALKDRVDLSLAITAGSSIQVATFVAPVLVLASLFYPTRLNLVFQPLELAILGLATILFPLVSLDGESTWLEGIQLVAVYLMACVVFFFVPG